MAAEETGLSNKPRGVWAALEAEKILCLRLALCILILFLNLGFTLWAFLLPQAKYGDIPNPEGSYGDEHHAYAMAILYQGNCNFVQRLDTWVHVGLNVISSLMLWSSSACVQILNSPTRHELNRAHSCMRWMDVGVPSLRNIRKKSRSHVACWSIIIFTTSLLHLFWNSAIFSALPTSAYAAAVTTADFDTNLKPWSDASTDYSLQTRGLDFERLDNEECIKRYISPFNEGMDLIVVTNQANNNMSYDDGTTLIYDFTVPGSVPWTQGNTWLCSYAASEHFCNEELLEKDPQDWQFKFVNSKGTSFLLPITYCQSNGIHDLTNSCRWYCSFPILTAVCVINLIQCFCIYFTLRSQMRNPSLICIGDVIASYLQNPEERSKGMCLVSKADVSKSLTPWPEGPQQWFPKANQRWYEAIGGFYFFTLCAFMFILLIVIIYEMAKAILSLSWYGLNSRIGLQDIWSYGLGHPQVFTMMQTFANYQIGGTPSPSTFLGAVLLANTPQLVASIIYQLVFSQLCSMLVAIEWSHFSGAPIKPRWWKWPALRAALAWPLDKIMPDKRGIVAKGDFIPLRETPESEVSAPLRSSIGRQTLRVSYPEKWQRSSYLASIPLRYALPFTVLAGIVHGFLSQSLFVIVTISFDANQERNPRDDSCNVGWSYGGWILSSVTFFGCLVVFFAMGLRRFAQGRYQMPLASTCSIAISAACHRLPHEPDAHLYSLEWGDVTPAGPDGEAEDVVGHCCFTTSPLVRPPMPGKYYA